MPLLGKAVVAGLSRSLRAATIQFGGNCKVCVLAGAINSVWFAGSHRALRWGGSVATKPGKAADAKTRAAARGVMQFIKRSIDGNF